MNPSMPLNTAPDIKLIGTAFHTSQAASELQPK
jgi:hypothetical protein